MASIDTDTDELIRGLERYGIDVGLAERRIARRMVQLGHRYQTIQERWCNEEMTDATSARLESREQTIEAEVTSLASQLPSPSARWNGEDWTGTWAVNFEGDPRGWVIALVPICEGEDATRVRRESSRFVGVV